MGDSGALMLGLLMATSAIAITGQLDPAIIDDNDEFGRSQLLGAFIPILLPVVVVLLPLLDFGLAVIRRMRAGKSPFSPDRKHLHHRMLDMGHSDRDAVLIFYAWTAIVSLVVPADVHRHAVEWPRRLPASASRSASSASRRASSSPCRPVRREPELAAERSAFDPLDAATVRTVAMRPDRPALHVQEPSSVRDPRPRPAVRRDHRHPRGRRRSSASSSPGSRGSSSALVGRAVARLFLGMTALIILIAGRATRNDGPDPDVLRDRARRLGDQARRLHRARDLAARRSRGSSRTSSSSACSSTSSHRSSST